MSMKTCLDFLAANVKDPVKWKPVPFFSEGLGVHRLMGFGRFQHEVINQTDIDYPFIEHRFWLSAFYLEAVFSPVIALQQELVDELRWDWLGGSGVGIAVNNCQDRMSFVEGTTYSGRDLLWNGNRYHEFIAPNCNRALYICYEHNGLAGRHNEPADTPGYLIDGKLTQWANAISNMPSHRLDRLPNIVAYTLLGDITSAQRQAMHRLREMY